MCLLGYSCVLTIILTINGTQQHFHTTIIILNLVLLLHTHTNVPLKRLSGILPT